MDQAMDKAAIWMENTRLKEAGFVPGTKKTNCRLTTMRCHWQRSCFDIFVQMRGWTRLRGQPAKSQEHRAQQIVSAVEGLVPVVHVSNTSLLAKRSLSPVQRQRNSKSEMAYQHHVRGFAAGETGSPGVPGQQATSSDWEGKEQTKDVLENDMQGLSFDAVARTHACTFSWTSLRVVQAQDLALLLIMTAVS
jgi:hypothetical protein